MIYVFTGILVLTVIYMGSQKLSDDAEMSLFQILEAGELFVEVLGQIEHLLGHIENLVFAHSADLDQSCDDLSVDQVFLLQLLTDFECNVDSSDGEKAWIS